MIAMAFKTLLVTLSKLIISYLPVVLTSVVMDVIDEAMETLLENAEAEAEVNPDKASRRRLMLYRKYWEGFKEYRNRKDL